MAQSTFPSATFHNAYDAGLFSYSPDSTTLEELCSYDSTHPYPVIEARKRRKAWNHVLEKAIFTSDEICDESAPQRRKVYVSSLEAHVDALHDQLLQSVCVQKVLSYSSPFPYVPTDWVCGPFLRRNWNDLED